MTAKEIKNLREKLKLTQAALAKLLGVHRTTVAMWEIAKGKIKRRKDEKGEG